MFAQQVTRNVQLGREAAEGALGSVQSGKGAVYQAIEGMASVQTSVQETGKAVSTLQGLSSDIGEGMQALSDIIEHLGLLAQNAQLLEAFSGEQGQKTAGVAEDLGLIGERARTVYAQLDGLSKSSSRRRRRRRSACAAGTQEAASRRSPRGTGRAGVLGARTRAEPAGAYHDAVRAGGRGESCRRPKPWPNDMTQLVEEMARAHTRRQDAAAADPKPRLPLRAFAHLCRVDPAAQRPAHRRGDKSQRTARPAAVWQTVRHDSRLGRGVGRTRLVRLRVKRMSYGHAQYL